MIKAVTILKNLVRNSEYSGKVLPFLKREYFESQAEQRLFDVIKSYIDKYSITPKINSIMIELEGDRSIPVGVYDKIIEIVGFIEEDEEREDLPWLMDMTEGFCKDRALYLALTKAIDISDKSAQGSKNISLGEIPELLTEALSVSFDTHIGHDYTASAIERYSAYKNGLNKIPFDISLMNELTNGGVTRKTFNMVTAGCVHPDTLVRVRRNMEDEMVVKISEIEQLLDKYEVFIDSPDGFVPVTEFVDKGEWDEYILKDLNGNDVRVNQDHFFETSTGWVAAKNMTDGVNRVLKPDGEFHDVTVQKTGNRIPIVDLVINHPNHRYFANGFSSHNTNVGKSLILCHLASHYLQLGMNVIYFTGEMSEDKIGERIDANLLNVPINSLRDLSESDFLWKTRKRFEPLTSKLIIKEYPTSTVSSNHLEHFIKELRLKKKFKPDVIIVDYLNIFVSSRVSLGGTKGGSYEYLKLISEELRALAVRHNAVLWTASQLNRDGYRSNDPGIDDTGESFGINFAADVVFLAYVDALLLSEGKMMIKLDKTRNSKKTGRLKGMVGVDYDYMRIFDLP